MKPPDHIQQITAILGPDVFKWAIEMLPDDVSIDDVRYGDLIDVSEDEVVAHAMASGFDARVVADDRIEDDRTCLVKVPGGWSVFYIERGSRSDERPSLAATTPSGTSFADRCALRESC